MILLDGQKYSVKKYRIRLSVVDPSAVAGSELRSTARSIQSKSTEFVCPSSTRPLSLARNCARRPEVFSQKVQNSSVRRQPVRCRWLGTALDGQTYSVKKYRIRLSVVNPSAVAGSELRSKLLDGQTYSVKNNRICLAVVNLSAVTGLELRSTARQISRKEQNSCQTRRLSSKASFWSDHRPIHCDESPRVQVTRGKRKNRSGLGYRPKY
jgi:hypothetical protein